MIINSDSWFVNLIITFAGVFLALLLQELVSSQHRKRNTRKFSRFFVDEINYNLSIVQSIIENCDDMLQRLSNPKNPFGFSGVFSISGIALTFRRDAYDALKQSEHHLNFPLEILLTISKTYSRLIDINLFVTTMVKTWEASVEEAKRENIDSQVVSDQRKKHTRTLFQSVRAIALEAQTDLCDLLAKL